MTEPTVEELIADITSLYDYYKRTKEDAVYVFLQIKIDRLKRQVASDFNREIVNEH